MIASGLGSQEHSGKKRGKRPTGDKAGKSLGAAGQARVDPAELGNVGKEAGRALGDSISRTSQGGGAVSER